MAGVACGLLDHVGQYPAQAGRSAIRPAPTRLTAEPASLEGLFRGGPSAGDRRSPGLTAWFVVEPAPKPVVLDVSQVLHQSGEIHAAQRFPIRCRPEVALCGRAHRGLPSWGKPKSRGQTWTSPPAKDPTRTPLCASCQRPLRSGHDWGMSSDPERKTPAHAGANDFFDTGSPIIAAPFDVKCRTPKSRSACWPTSTTAPSPSAVFTGTLAMFQRAGFTEIGRTYPTRPDPTRDETHTYSPLTDPPARQIRAPFDPRPTAPMLCHTGTVIATTPEG